MRVLKFGGTSVGTPENIKKIVTLVSSRADVSVVVVSAFSGVTDTLLKLTKDTASSGKLELTALSELKNRHQSALDAVSPGNATLLDDLLEQLKKSLEQVASAKAANAEQLDAIAAFGELLSAKIVTEAFLASSYTPVFLDAREVLVTSTEHGNARILLQESEIALREKIKPGKLIVTTGFIGRSSSGATTTLGRGGSDYTAAVLAALTNADMLEIWTDVDGMLTADPRKVKKSFPIPQVSYEEALELCHFGAKVIYPPTLQPAIERSIPILIKNTFNPSAPGTLITKDASRLQHPITGITSIPSVSLLSIIGSGLIGVSGTAMRFFRALAEERLNVILITQASSEHSICVAMSPTDAERGSELVKAEFMQELESGLVNEIRVEPGYSVLAVVGENMRHTPGLSGKLFSALGRNGINIVAIAQGSSERNISTVIDSTNEAKALNVVHDSLFLSDRKRLNVALVGLGTVGQTLLRQLNSQSRHLENEYGLEVQIVALANSKRMLIDKEGLQVESLEEAFEHGEKTNFASLLSKLVALNLPNLVFVDCTASDDVSALYEQILDKSIPVVTANKRAQSGSGESFKSLHRVANKRGVELLYETSVGAALPIIGTLRDLRKSGDTIRRIEAVLSGTLSFIFNSLDQDRTLSFSEVVKRAKEKGYTEPDPRDDLRGTDVARKVVILGREAGFELELAGVEISPLLPPELFAIDSVEEFMRALPKIDSEFSSKVAAAKSGGGKLCALARIEKDVAEVTLEILPPSHPFMALSGSDNIVMISSDRYSTRPLVIQGPGAGADVTAGGVFADILRVANR